MVLPGAEAEGWSQGQVALRASLAAKLTVVLCLIRNENAEEGRAVSVEGHSARNSEDFVLQGPVFYSG